MRRLIILVTVLLVSAGAQAEVRSDWTESCSERNFRFDDQRSYVEEQTIEAGNLPLLKASVSNAPVSVRGGSGSGYTIRVCKAAARVEDLAAIQVSVVGGELRTTGPEGRGRWSVSYRIEAPMRANMEIETKNGPISFRDVDGRIVARAKNGPLSLKNVTGDVDVNASNGPISIAGGSGVFRMETSNGPLSIRLAGSSWQGTLDATTKNGPVTLRIPEGYASGVVVEASGAGPMSCRAAGCERYETQLRREHGRWSEEPRRVELGSGATAVRIATVNGPVTIREE
jgi:hypothetical protein